MRGLGLANCRDKGVYICVMAALVVGYLCISVYKLHYTVLLLCNICAMGCISYYEYYYYNEHTHTQHCTL